MDTAVLRIAGISGTRSAKRVPFSQAIAEAGYEALDQAGVLPERRVDQRPAP